jgi:hypothetical protein
MGDVFCRLHRIFFSTSNAVDHRRPIDLDLIPMASALEWRHPPRLEQPQHSYTRIIISLLEACDSIEQLCLGSVDIRPLAHSENPIEQQRTHNLPRIAQHPKTWNGTRLPEFRTPEHSLVEALHTQKHHMRWLTHADQLATIACGSILQNGPTFPDDGQEYARGAELGPLSCSYRQQRRRCGNVVRALSGQE